MTIAPARARRARSGLLLIFSLAGCALLPGGGAPDYTVTVEAGAFDRRGTPVSFALPEDAAGRDLHLEDEAGRRIPLQVDGAEAHLLLDHLPAGETRRYRLRPGAVPAAGVQAREEDGGVSLSLGGAPVLRYNFAEADPPRPGTDPVYRRGGYIHPLRTPSGRVVTDDYPADHLHHHGVWGAWTSTVFEGRKPDFWNMGDRTGTVLPVALDSSWSGPVHGGFRARHRYVDLSASPARNALDEQWTVRVYNVPGGERPYRIFDLDVVQTTATSSPLLLPEYRYGGVGFRGRGEWNGAANAFFLTSEGKDRSNGHATRARWAHMGGYVDGQLAGVAFLGHPDNFRAPQPMRIHPTEPFFNWAPSQAGDWAIRPGEPYRARYRFVAHDGAPDLAELDRLWNDYAVPPRVTVERR
jgi:hypothetical protein